MALHKDAGNLSTPIKDSEARPQIEFVSFACDRESD